MESLLPTDRPPVTSNHVWTWPVLIGCIMLLQFSIVGTLIVASSSNPSFAVEPNSYQKAVHWNDAAAQRQANERLGWRTEIAVSDHASIVGEREISLAMHDPAGAPIDDASVSAQVFHHARAKERATIEFEPRGGGNYVARARLDREGSWEMRFTAARGGTIFTKTVIESVNSPIGLMK